MWDDNTRKWVLDRCTVVNESDTHIICRVNMVGYFMGIR